MAELAEDQAKAAVPTAFRLFEKALRRKRSGIRFDFLFNRGKIGIDLTAKDRSVCIQIEVVETGDMKRRLENAGSLGLINQRSSEWSI